MNLRKAIYLMVAAGAVWACTDIEPKNFEHIGGYNTENTKESKAYYEALRAYKKTAENYGRPVAFGWYSNWAPTGTARKGYLSSIPDSMDIVSMWSGAPGRYEITDAQKADKEFVQKVKGTKLLEVSLMSHLGKGRTPESIYDAVEKQAKEEEWSASKLAEARKFARWDFWGFKSHDLSNKEELHAALSTFAKALCDSLYVSEWDGFDLDWEPGSGFNDADGTIDIEYLITEMGKYIGPKSDKGDGNGHKLLVVDGIYYSLGSVAEYVDYWIEQAYGRVDRYFSTPDNRPEKLITCENFESNFASGGRLLQQAEAMPAEGYKGGVGAYRFDNDHSNTPDYKWMRQAIQINQRVFNEWKEKQAAQAD